MQLIIAGASGYLATELVRQALSHPKITTLYALARHRIPTPGNLGPNAELSKLMTMTVEDYDEYAGGVGEAFTRADACIWTVAVTPAKSRRMEFEMVKKICQCHTLLGLKAMATARPADKAPFRFLYVSGAAAERDQTKTPSFMPEYSLMRGETENQVVSYASTHGIEACVAKPGLITNGAFLNGAFATVLKWTGMVENVALPEIAAALLQQVVDGFEKETLENGDLVRIGREALGL